MIMIVETRCKSNSFHQICTIEIVGFNDSQYHLYKLKRY